MKYKLVKGLSALAISVGVFTGGCLLNPTTAHASERVIATGVTSASYLNVRAGESTHHKVIGGLPRNSRIEIVSLDGSWDKINYKGRTGYVCHDYVKNVNKLSQEKGSCNANVTASGLNLRTSASTSSHIITCIPHGRSVSVISESNGWSKVNYNGRIGYVATRYLSSHSLSQSSSKPAPRKEQVKASTQTVNKKAIVTASALNVRTGRGTNYGVKACLPHGRTVTILDVSGDWARVDYGDGQGYVAYRYLGNVTSAPKPSSSSSQTKVVVHENAKNQTDWVAKLKVAQQTNQLVTVQATGTRAVVQFHQKGSDGKWKKTFDVKGFIGYGGLCNPNTRHEGTGTTPTGVYDFGQLFGVAPNPGTSMPYTQLTWHHWWVGDSNSKYFNTLQDRRTTGKYWSTAGGEAIIDKPQAYKYGIAINYNMNRSTAYRGWGIHMHCADHLKHATAGCVGIPSSAMKEFLQQVKPGAKIVISTPQGVYNY